MIFFPEWWQLLPLVGFEILISNLNLMRLISLCHCINVSSYLLCIEWRAAKLFPSGLLRPSLFAPQRSSLIILPLHSRILLPHCVSITNIAVFFQFFAFDPAVIRSHWSSISTHSTMHSGYESLGCIAMQACSRVMENCLIFLSFAALFAIKSLLLLSIISLLFFK